MIFFIWTAAAVGARRSQRHTHHKRARSEVTVGRFFLCLKGGFRGRRE